MPLVRGQHRARDLGLVPNWQLGPTVPEWEPQQGKIGGSWSIWCNICGRQGLPHLSLPLVRVAQCAPTLVELMLCMWVPEGTLVCLWHRGEEQW